MNYNYIVPIIGGILFLINLICVIIDANYKPELNEDGKFELKNKYSLYVTVIFQIFGIFIMMISTLDAIYEASEMKYFFFVITIVLFISLIYSILNILNCKIIYDETSIVKINFLNNKSEISFRNLATVKYTLFGLGRDLIFKDKNDKKIKISSYTSGFSSLVKFLKDQSLLKK